MSLKIGLIGAGFMSGVHRANLERDDRVRISGIYDVDPLRAGALAVASVDDLLEASDAVYVVSPNTTHVDMAMKALAAGKHVFCEKPMATTLEDAQRLHAAARASKTVFQVGHNRRFAPVYKNVKKLLETSPAHCAHIKMNRGELLNPAWVGDAAVTGGFLFETPIHMFDMMRFLLGEIVSVQARESRKDDYSMLVEFDGGQHATFVTSADTSWFFPYESVEVYGEYSTIRTEEMEKLEWRIGLDKPTSVENFANLTREEKWGFAEEDRLFVDAMLAGSKPPVTSYDGLKSVEMTMAVYRSAREKMAVSLEL
ncbi:MAG: Gfo/Idh/MocA family oxidoreductase [Acidobacteria bacterium]|nr:Gfo/Idh/MocA family oxidoreductase [Acidobacteriota bacterium]MDA1234537.1 Gfo/Idh/MocA family oxidoreductase [Acidobacteriota bacterium]